jgi:hypothetical protein
LNQDGVSPARYDRERLRLLTEGRAIARRHDKTDNNLPADIGLAAAVIAA